MDALLIGAGLAVLGTAIPAIFRPDLMVRESARHHKRRLRELQDGAPEAYFEERRELEAYPPRYDFSDRTIRWLGVIGTGIGLFSIYQGMTQ